MKRMIVMDVRVSSVDLWAWCVVGDGHGFEEITYTSADGYAEPYEGPTGPIRWGREVFSYDLADPEPAPFRYRETYVLELPGSMTQREVRSFVLDEGWLISATKEIDVQVTTVGRWFWKRHLVTVQGVVPKREEPALP